MVINWRQLILFCICIVCVVAYYVVKHLKLRKAIRLQKEKDALHESVETESEEAENEH